MKFILLIKFDSTNYTLDNFELFNFYVINKIGFTLTFSFATMVYWPLMYVIFTQSPKRMKVYSLITAYELTVAYSFAFTLFVAQPVFLFPYKGAYITGFWQVGEGGNPFLFFSVILNILLLFHAVGTHLFYRLGSLYTSDHKLSFFSKPKKLNSVLIPAMIALLSATIIGFSLDQPEGELFRSILASEHPYFETFFKMHPFAMGYHELYSNYIELLFLSIGIVAILALPFLLLIYGFFYQRLRHFQKNLASSKQRWHIMYLKALLANGASIIFYLLIPLEIFCVSFFCPWQKAALCGSVMPLIASQYVIAASLTRIYFIKPYYNYFIKIFYKLFPKAAKRISRISYN